jgi:hypothetical protein
MKAKCEIVAQAFDGMIPRAQHGKYDAIMAGMNITDKRKEAIAFTEPYGRTPSTFAVLKSSPLAKLPDAGKVYSLNPEGLSAAEKSINDIKPMLKGKVIGVQTSTAQANFLEKYFKDVVDIRQYKTPSSTTSISPPAGRRRIRVDLVSQGRRRGTEEQGHDARRTAIRRRAPWFRRGGRPAQGRSRAHREVRRSGQGSGRRRDGEDALDQVVRLRHHARALTCCALFVWRPVCFTRGTIRGRLRRADGLRCRRAGARSWHGRR